MSWRNQGITGSNNIPLGNRRRFGGDNADDGGYNPAAPAEGLSELKRGRSPQRGKSSSAYTQIGRILILIPQIPKAPASARSATVGAMPARTRLPA
jgi:hypothetical protein